MNCFIIPIRKTRTKNILEAWVDWEWFLFCDYSFALRKIATSTGPRAMRSFSGTSIGRESGGPPTDRPVRLRQAGLRTQHRALHPGRVEGHVRGRNGPLRRVDTTCECFVSCTFFVNIFLIPVIQKKCMENNTLFRENTTVLSPFVQGYLVINIEKKIRFCHSRRKARNIETEIERFRAKT